MYLSLLLYLFSFLELSYCDGVKSKYIQFSNQLGTPLREVTSFATLKSGDVGELSSGRFTICGSIYIASESQKSIDFRAAAFLGQNISA